MCIVTGPRIDLAIALIDRMKKLFAGKHLNTFDTKETEKDFRTPKVCLIRYDISLFLSFLC
jgi:hypothetical protein